MKTISLLSIVSLAVFTTAASAAPRPEAAVYVLPTYVVTAPLHQPAEQRVITSLDELRQQARTPAFVALDLPLLRNPQLRPTLPNLAPRALTVAKL